MPFKQWVFPTGENIEGRKKRIELSKDGDRIIATEYLLPPKWAPLGAMAIPLHTGSMSVEEVRGMLADGHDEADVARHIAYR